jgi:hypothetical protein
VWNLSRVTEATIAGIDPVSANGGLLGTISGIETMPKYLGNAPSTP